MIFFLIAFGFIVLAFALFMKAAVQFARIKSNERLTLAVQEQTAALRTAEIEQRKVEAKIEQRGRNVGEIGPEAFQPATAGGIEDEWPDTIE